MSQTAVIIAAFVVGVLALMTASSDAAPVYVGQNATLCRGRNVTFAVRGNCSAFYQCQNNNVWFNTCQSPLLYNQTNGMCDYPWKVTCNIYAGILLNGPRSNSASKSFVSAKAAVPLGYNATLCRGYNGTHPVKGACNQYYVCQNNYVYRNSCASPLLYNEKNGYCDYAWNVNCNRTAPMKAAAVQRTGLAAGQVPKSAARTFPGQVSPVNNCHPSEITPCFVDPCQVAAPCKNPSAVCLSDYCGGCHAKWFTIQLVQGTYKYVPAVCRD